MEVNQHNGTCHKTEISYGSKKITIETGRVAKQAAGSVLVSIEGTVILCTVAVNPEPKPGQDFFPLTVDYRERTYAAGRIPGGFFKRETRPRDKETLTSRLIDRSIRPLFPEGFLNAVQVNAVVLSSDLENDTDILSMIGASTALMLSELPFKGPISAVRVGLINGQFMLNPTFAQQAESTLDLVVAGSKNAIMMVESGSTEITEDKLIEALELARTEIVKACAEQEKFTKSIAKEKIKFEPAPQDAALVSAVEAAARDKIKKSVRTKDKSQRENAMAEMKQAIVKSLEEKFPDQAPAIGAVIENILYEEARALILKEKLRTDGRKWDEIRSICIDTSVLPRTHGSAIFTRGQTQALATVTLGSPEDRQVMDVLEGEYKERFILHYNFPGFATGEAKGERSPGRREIGHGALARRSLLALLPTEDEFPYTIRIVSDILESNGSSSMASVCGGSLALFDAGVPMKAACAGIAMGLITDGGNFAVLSDIMGLEDHLGDMDFKVAGTKDGITALQMDIKIEGISIEIMKQAIHQAQAGRLHILSLMQKAIDAPRAELSSYAPKMVTVMIPKEKIGALIGPGGKNIRGIAELTGAEVNVDDDGRVTITGVGAESVDAAKAMVEGSVAEVEVGRIYKGKVTRLMNFGAFVEVLPGKEGLVHISQLDVKRVEKVEDVVKEGDIIDVKCVEIDTMGRVNLSRKAVLMPEGSAEDFITARPSRPEGGRPPFRRGGGRG
ncbi:MAG: polyribonucleotide nucleotidyltransferase [Elusimicrobia bacterium RIFCSPLOWO2_01_FULL_54_10]|nr:MAG: polyribonucleotide nucleotidyltransferase [Elusimicrobia bacterium RIFCSPLOWO2_01_FULL_54_10]